MFSFRSLALAMAAWPMVAASLPAAKPEDAGMSTERLQRIHESIQRHIEAGEISGAVTAVARRGRVVHFKAHGLMDIESKKPMEKDAIFRLASMSKPITGVAVMMLVEEGKIRLSDPVSKFLPEFRDMKVAMPREHAAGPVRGAAEEPDFYTIPVNREITIQDLLTHTSGLVSTVSGGFGVRLAAKLAPRGPADTLASYVPKLATIPLDFQPGTQWAYSGGAGPDTLSRIVEIVSGQTYDEFLRTRIFEPLGMKDTFFYPPDDKRPRLVTLYRKTPNGLEKSANQDGFSSNTYFSGAGGLMSTAADYLQFGQMLLNGGELNGKRLFEPAHGGTDGLQPRRRYVRRKAGAASARNGFRPDRAGGGRQRGGGSARRQRQLRLGRRIRHAGVGRAKGEDGHRDHDSDADPAGAARFRKRGDAGHHRVRCKLGTWHEFAAFAKLRACTRFAR